MVYSGCGLLTGFTGTYIGLVNMRYREGAVAMVTTGLIETRIINGSTLRLRVVPIWTSTHIPVTIVVGIIEILARSHATPTSEAMVNLFVTHIPTPASGTFAGFDLVYWVYNTCTVVTTLINGAQFDWLNTCMDITINTIVMRTIEKFGNGILRNTEKLCNIFGKLSIGKHNKAENYA